ncbi:transglycosylase SLT domain-containing protein [Persicobacter psychrovividus]|uniref:Lytic transglycosylase F n=1 Tax=Persicobacter psychrovividus TaxID=387638 RepID=A0ABN6L9S5_9BACT|nr:lytic transglycosylase F [Persicobacter psychrovividus]
MKRDRLFVSIRKQNYMNIAHYINSSFNRGARFLYAAVMLSLIPTACRQTSTNTIKAEVLEHQLVTHTPMVEIDLKEIKDRGYLTAILYGNRSSYYLYKGTPRGYEYELLQSLSKSLDVDLKVKMTDSFASAMKLLNAGEGDVIAHNLSQTNRRKLLVNFTDALREEAPALVQRKVGRKNPVSPEQPTEFLVKRVELANKTVYVAKNTVYANMLHRLSLICKAPVDVQVVDKSTDELIREVAEGLIDYTIADQYIANSKAVYFGNLDTEMAIDEAQPLSWAVRKNSPELLAATNDWLTQIKRTFRFNGIYNRYFMDEKRLKLRNDSEFSSLNGARLSPYDELIREGAENIRWDWRLLAAQIYQESLFNPHAKSWMGAEGLMQVMPNTAKFFGKDSEKLYDPHHNIEAGTEYLNWLNKFWAKRVENPEERIKFILASYNAGQGHVLDAQRLAEKYGKDTKTWDDNVEVFMLKKSEAEYYKDPVVKSGYCRGREPVAYVKNIMSRYESYQQLIPS